MSVSDVDIFLLFILHLFQIMAQEQIEDETEVFDDMLLQYLSAICPSGMYNHSSHNLFKSTVPRLPIFQERSDRWPGYG